MTAEPEAAANTKRKCEKETDEIPHFKFFKIETNGVAKLEDNALVYSLDGNGNWVRNQNLYSMFVDSMYDYWPISEDEVNEIIKKRKRKGKGV